MDKKLMALNIVWAVFDTIIAALAIAVLAWATWHFGKWWLLIGAIVPLSLYSNHSAIIDADITEAKLSQYRPNKSNVESDGDNDKE